MAVNAQDAAPKAALLYDAKFRSILYQIITLALLVAFIAFLATNTINNLEKRGIATGFEFLNHPAGFGVPFSLIEYSEASTYGRAFVVSVLNTLFVSACGIVLATILGFILGVARLSPNWIIARIATVYVEVIRNVPLLLQILFWYVGVLSALPVLRNSINIGDSIFLNNRGFYTPVPVAEPGFMAIPIAFVIGVIGASLVGRWAKKRQEATGAQFPVFLTGTGLIIGLPVLAAIVTGFPWTMEYPELKGFNFRGGFVIIPEFAALLFALTLYTAAFIGEIVRAGIQAVSHGQTEAAHALGIRPGPTMRLVIIPQAMRVIVPPLTSQYLNLTKNSSLAAAVGYPDLVHMFTGTVLNQTGQALETIGMMMLVYLTISLSISAFMNWYNARIALVER
ncbi:MAG: amino acid ABC transporter permease [Minwuiales bacterium]|nr:amino acid ABC transporter permease [Minwuiales bacterium]